MRARNRTPAPEVRPATDARMAYPNGSEVYDKDSARLKGYCVYRGAQTYEAITVDHKSLGVAGLTDAMNKLNQRTARLAAIRG